MPHTPTPWIGLAALLPCSYFHTCLSGCSRGRGRSATGRGATSVATATPLDREAHLPTRGARGRSAASWAAAPARPAGPAGTPPQGADLAVGARLIRNAGSPLMRPSSSPRKDTIG
jgi:hypothetical protein